MIKPGLRFKLCHTRYEVVKVSANEIETVRLADDSKQSWVPKEFIAQLENMHKLENE